MPLIMEYVLSQDNISIPNYSYSDELEKYKGRSIRTVKIEDLKNEKMPIFIKPVEAKDAANGAYLISSEMSDGKVKWVEAVSEKGADVTIVTSWENVRITDEKENPIEVTAGRTKNTQEDTVPQNVCKTEESFKESPKKERNIYS